MAALRGDLFHYAWVQIVVILLAPAQVLPAWPDQESLEKKMHELPVAESILEIALRHAQQAGARRITAVDLLIGDLSSFIDESIQFYWDMISQDTAAQGAQLRFRRVPAKVKCLDCGHQFEPGKTIVPCPECGGAHLRVLDGDQLQVEAIEVE